MTFDEAREIVNRHAYENDFRPLEAHFTALITADGSGYQGTALNDVRHINWFLRNFNLRLDIVRPARGDVHCEVRTAR